MKSDIPVKRILQVRPEDWVSYLFPTYINATIREINSVIVPKTESRLDNVHFINDEFIFHLEANGYKDKAMPARMLRYKADIWEYTMNKNLGVPKIYQALLLFFEEDDNGQHSLKDDFIEFNYTVIKAWEMDKTIVVEKKLIGLYPLIPLMRNNQNELPETVLRNTVNIIESVSNESLRNDLLAVMSVLASEKFTKDLVLKYIRREFIMQSTLLQELTEEIMEDAKKERGIEIAKKLIKRGRDLQEISEDTGLSIKEIKSLQLS